MTDVLDDLLNWKDNTVVVEMRQTADDVQHLMWKGAEEIERLRAALKSAGDDYPGSSFQKWCYEQAGIPLSASPKLGEVLQQIRAERATSPTDAGQEQ